MAICSALTLGGIATPATAASLQGMISFGGYHIGIFHTSTGEAAYCLEPGMNTPLAAQQAPAEVTELPGYSVFVDDGFGWRGQISTAPASGKLLQQINWLLGEHGMGASAEKAVAVQLALWGLRREAGNAAWLNSKLQLVRQHGGEQYIAQAEELLNEARSKSHQPQQPQGELRLTIADPHGSGKISYPQGTTSITLQGAVFSDGSPSATISDNLAGELNWQATLHANAWEREHTIRATGTWQLAEDYWPAAVRLHPPTVQNQQRLGAAVSPLKEVLQGEFAAVTATIDSRFDLLVQTAAPAAQHSADSTEFNDVVTVLNGPAGKPWPVRQANGTFMPLLAQGTLYGPFNTAQTRQPAAPAGAPIAASAQLIVDRGPGDYQVQKRLEQVEAGYYYWVWQISEANQSPEIKATGLLAPGSVYADDFGAISERQIAPVEINVNTQLNRHTITGDRRLLVDRFRLSPRGGAWPRDDSGERISPRVRFTFYNSAARPTQQATVPATATAVGTVFAESTHLNVWQNSPEFAVPQHLHGWITVQACVLASDQKPAVRMHFRDWCDSYGVPAESATIEEPPLAQTGAKNSQLILPVAFAASGSGLALLAIPWRRKWRRLFVQKPCS